MKINIKILIICILIILSVIPSVYAYWTDKVNAEINLIITYDAKLNILNIPVPVEQPVEEIPTQVEVLPPDEGAALVTNGFDSPDLETGGEDISDINSDDLGGYDAETEEAQEVKNGNSTDLSPDNSDPEHFNEKAENSQEIKSENNTDLNPKNSDEEMEESQETKSKNDTDLSPENSDAEKEQIQDNQAENEQ